MAATLPYGLSPLVVPQLKTITLGGAVTGLGIESASFRNGLPHESVLEMDILTGAGELITASADQHADLFRAFPNSYGTLGYSTRLRIELEPVAPFVALRHIRFHSLTGDDRGDGTHHRYRRTATASQWITSTVWCSAPTRATCASARAPPPRDRSATTPGNTSTTGRFSTTSGVKRQRRPADDPRLPLALGHRLVLVLTRVRRTEPATAALVAAPLPAQQRLLEAHSR